MIDALKKIDNQSWIKIFLFFFLFSLFFPIRYVFLTHFSYLTGDYSDFTSFSLYLSDIFLIIAFFTILWSNCMQLLSIVKGQMSIVLLLIWLILAVFLLSNHISGLNIWIFFKFLEFIIVAYGTTYLIFTNFDIKLWFFRVFAWFCGLQSVIALIQFTKQSSLGLYRLGESHLAPNILGVAKLVSYGTKFIRGYGTFPHPNPLSAFLVAGVLITTYLLTVSDAKKAKIAYSLLLFLNILGLTVTFSRGAFLALGLGLVVFFIGQAYLIRRNPDPALVAGEGSQIADSSPSYALGFRMTPVLVVIVSIIASFIIFRPFLLTRATFSDQSTVDRKFYDQMGLKMAQQNPLFGVGAGESVLHMEQVSGKTLAPWEKQPPHNYFIIAAAELGIPFALILIWIFLSYLKAISYQLKANFSTYNLLLTCLLLCFLLLMMFDHYFYTLEQTQLLLWLLLGIIAAETNKKIPT